LDNSCGVAHISTSRYNDKDVFSLFLSKKASKTLLVIVPPNVLADVPLLQAQLEAYSFGRKTSSILLIFLVYFHTNAAADSANFRA
jgi:hypothetical protein